MDRMCVCLVDASAVASALRLGQVTGRRWAAVTGSQENDAYRPASANSSGWRPRDFAFGRVVSATWPRLEAEWWSDVFGRGPCDGRGLKRA